LTSTFLQIWGFFSKNIFILQNVACSKFNKINNYGLNTNPKTRATYNTTIKSGLPQEQQDKNRAAKEIFFQFYID